MAESTKHHAERKRATAVVDKYCDERGGPPAIDLASDDKGGDSKLPRQADTLIEVADGTLLFHSPEGTAYADIEVNGHRETHRVRAKGFRRFLVQRFFLATHKAPGSEALQAALNVIEAKAHYEGPELNVGLRVAGHDKLYLDLGDEHWRAVEIDAAGWQTADRPTVRFRRAPGMMPLPMPAKGGSVEALRPFLNVQSKEQFVLAVAWALAALRNCGPYPVLALAGEQGSAKSTLSKLLRWLIDPNAAPLRALPREDRDLFIAANNGHVLVFDNVSGLPFWISDTICRLATGGGFSVRQLYTDQDEVLFDAQRPVILNGIEEIVERPDLADRSLFLTLDPIPKNKRRPEREIMEEFEAARPAILGGLLDTVVIGLRRQPLVELDELPRMADFALWVTACEAGLWKKGTFMAAYTGNIEEATQVIIEGDVVAAAVAELMVGRTEWTGAAKDLLGALDDLVGESTTRKKEWPKTPKSLSGKLTRLAPSFRKIGLEITRLPRTESIRPLRLEWAGKQPSFSSGRSSNPQDRPFGHDGRGVHHADRDDGRKLQSSFSNARKTQGNDGDDANDGHSPLYSSSSDGDLFASLRDPKYGLQPKVPDLPDLPECLDPRKRTSEP